MSGIFGGQQDKPGAEPRDDAVEVSLEKLDAIRRRLDVTFAEAREALIEARGDVVEAILRLEQSLGQGESTGEETEGAKRRIEVSTPEDEGPRQEWKELTSKMEERGSDVARKIMDVLKQGNSTRVVVSKGDRVLLDVPATVAAVGTILGPYVAVAGIGAALLTRCNLEVRRPGQGRAEEGKGGSGAKQDTGEAGSVE